MFVRHRCSGRGRFLTSAAQVSARTRSKLTTAAREHEEKPLRIKETHRLVLESASLRPAISGSQSTVDAPVRRDTQHRLS